MTTPIEIYDGIYVKREDLCFGPPAPPFSKCRGVVSYLTKLKQKGVKVVGYTETSISMAGWAVSWICKELGMIAVIFEPQYLEMPETLLYHRQQWIKFDASIYPIPAGRAKVGWYQSKKILVEKYGKRAVLLPLGLPFKETIEETEKEVLLTFKNFKSKNIQTVVVCVGSGTIASGIYRGLSKLGTDIKLYGVMCRGGGIENRQNIIERKSRILNTGFFTNSCKLTLIDPGYEYTEKVNFPVPFPCNPYYDLKAYKYLIENRDKMEENILFWNIGA